MLCDLGGSSVCRATLQGDKRKGKARWLLQFAIHKSDRYVKALKSGSTEQAGLHPTVPAYEEPGMFSLVFLKQQGNLKRSVLPLAVFSLSVLLCGYLSGELEPFCYTTSFILLLTVKSDTVPPFGRKKSPHLQYL